MKLSDIVELAKRGYTPADIKELASLREYEATMPADKKEDSKKAEDSKTEDSKSENAFEALIKNSSKEGN